MMSPGFKISMCSPTWTFSWPEMTMSHSWPSWVVQSMGRSWASSLYSATTYRGSATRFLNRAAILK